MAFIQRKNISLNNNVLYKSLGSLIKDYRQWHGFSQEKLAESVGVSVRQLQNWEADRHSARIENLHDLAEATGIPMQACVALNAEQPIWYSLKERRVAYSLVGVQHLGKEFLKYHKISRDETFAKPEYISTDKNITKILLCHSEIFSTEKTLGKDAIKAAVAVLPELNRIFFDSSGHYVGHYICLPIKMAIYQQLKKQPSFEKFLTSEKISDIIEEQEGVFFCYSIFVSSINVLHQMAINVARFFANIEHKERFFIAEYVAHAEEAELASSLGMVIAKNCQDRNANSFPQLYEINLNALMGPLGPWGWMLEEHGRRATAMEPANQELLGKTTPVSEVLTVDNHREVLSVDDSSETSSILNHKNQERENGIFNRLRDTVVCPNPKCAHISWSGENRIVRNGTYRSKDGLSHPRFLCKICGKSFSSKANTIFYGLRSPEDRILEAFKLLVSGMPLRRVACELEIELRTVRHWLNFAVKRSDTINTALMKALNVSQTELDDLWESARNGALRQRALLWRKLNASIGGKYKI